MTGFGAARVELDEGSVVVEARSVNSRHLKLSFRLPEELEGGEAVLRELAARYVSRGHVEIRVGWEADRERRSALELDEERVEAYLGALETLRRKYALSAEPDVSLLLRFGDVLREPSRRAASGLDPARLVEVTERALAELVEMREREGVRVEAELRERTAEIRRRVEAVATRAPERLIRERDRLRAAVEELAEGLALDDDRLLREIAVLAERWDIQEELVRTGAHLEAFEEYLDAPAAEPVGKRLAFLVQELLREINTMGSKGNDTAITRHVVEMKNEVERIREQVENVE
ncbi:MAG: YicC/YloC family endoribonuclease [Gemmatimonadota bacterium]